LLPSSGGFPCRESGFPQKKGKRQEIGLAYLNSISRARA